MSQLWWWCCCRFLFWGAQGASQLPGCEGEGGPVSFEQEGQSASGAVKGECFESALEFGGGVVAVCFCFGGGGGQSASGL